MYNLVNFHLQYNFNPNTLCWNWKGVLDRDGYGQYFNGTKQVRAHRYSYELFRHKIPEGLVIDHICKNRKCVNPAHLRVVTPRQNILENSESLQSKNYNKTHCINGHPLNSDNLYIRSDGYRGCRTCHRNEAKRHYYKDLNKANRHRKCII